jgi:HEAT repeat protein
MTPNAPDIETSVPAETAQTVEPALSAEIMAYLEGILLDSEDLDKRYIDLSATTEQKRMLHPTAWSREIIPPAFRVIDKQFNQASSEKSKLLESLSEAFELHECFVLLGAPGAGKSISLKKLRLDRAKLAQQNPEARIPILINLADWPEHITDVPGFLLYERQLQGLPPLHFNRLLILLDGLNEMPASKYKQRIKNIEDWLRVNPKLSVIISCREPYYQQSKKLSIPTVQIAPFDGARIQRFLQAYLGSDAAAQLLNQLGPLEPQQRAARDLIHLAENPFLLFMICYVYTQNQGQLPKSRGQLFQLFVQVLYKREFDQGTAEDISYQELVLGLSEMAFAMQQNRLATSVDPVWAAKKIPREFAVAAFWRLGREASLLNFFKQERIVQFTHQLILEYFAAEGLLRRLADLSQYLKKPAFIINKRASGAWDEVVYTLVGITDANQLLVQLAQIDPFLAVDCFEYIPQQVDLSDETQQFITHQLIEFLGSRNPQAREAAIFKAVQLGRITLPSLIERFEKGNKAAKRASLKALAQFDEEPQAIKTIVLALENRNKWVRSDAQAILNRVEPSKMERISDSLAHYKDAMTIKELIFRLSTATAKVNSIISSLAQMGHLAVEPLINALSNTKNEKLRIRVPKVLAKLGDGDAIEPLNKVHIIQKLIPYLTDKAPDVRGSTITALAQLGDAQIVDKLIPCLPDENPINRGATIKALAKLGDAQIVDKLIPYLEDENPQVQAITISVLGQRGDAQTIEKLIPYLEDKHPHVRIATISALAQRGDAQIVDKLIPCLQDEYPINRGATIKALARLGDVQIVEKLIPYLEDENPQVRATTISVLGQRGDAQIVDKLIPCLRDKEAINRSATIKALARFGDAQIVDKLIPYLDDENSAVRIAANKALQALGLSDDEIGDIRAVERIIIALENQSHRVRRKSVASLGKLGSTQTVKQKVKARIIQKLIPYLTDKASNVRGATITALAQLGDAQIVEKLIPCLQDNKPINRRATITALAQLGDAQIIEKLIPYLEDEPPPVRTATISVLGQRSDVQIIDKLIPYLEDKHPVVRAATISVLGQKGDAQIIEKLIPYLENEPPPVRAATISVLGQRGDVQIIEKLIPYLVEDEHPVVRAATISVLGQKGDAQIIEKLIPYLTDKPPDVRATTISVLAQLGDAQIIEKLIPYLTDKPPNVRATTNVLAQTGDTQIVEKLIPYLEDEPPLVRLATITVLGQRGDAQIVDKLIFLTDKKPEVRISRITVLAQFGDAQIVEKLIPYLEDEHPDVRAATITVLGQRGDAQIVQKLIPFLQDNASDVRDSTITALAQQLDDAQIVEKLIPYLEDENSVVRIAAKQVLQALGLNDDEIIRLTATKVIEGIDDDRVRELMFRLYIADYSQEEFIINSLAQLGDVAVEPLINALSTQHEKLRRCAPRILAQLGTPLAIEPLIKALDDKSEFVRKQVVNALAQLGNIQAINALKSKLSDPSPSVRVATINVLGQLGDAQLTEELISFLDDEASYVRGATITALAKLGDAQIVDKLIPCLQDEEPINRCATITALAQLGDVQIVNKLIPYLEDKHPEVRKTTISALVKLGDVRVIDKLFPYSNPEMDTLIQLLEDENPVRRTRAIKTLGALGNTKIIDQLIPKLEDENPVVRLVTKQALEQLGYKTDTLTKP